MLKGKRSEQNLQSKLVYSARAGTRDLSELGAGDVVVGPTPLGMVESVERLQTHLHRDPLPESEVLEQRGVQVVDTWIAEDVAA